MIVARGSWPLYLFAISVWSACARLVTSAVNRPDPVSGCYGLVALDAPHVGLAPPPVLCFLDVEVLPAEPRLSTSEDFLLAGEYTRGKLSVQPRYWWRYSCPHYSDVGFWRYREDGSLAISWGFRRLAFFGIRLDREGRKLVGRVQIRTDVIRRDEEPEFARVVYEPLGIEDLPWSSADAAIEEYLRNHCDPVEDSRGDR